MRRNKFDCVSLATDDQQQEAEEEEEESPLKRWGKKKKKKKGLGIESKNEHANGKK